MNLLISSATAVVYEWFGSSNAVVIMGSSTSMSVVSGIECNCLSIASIGIDGGLLPGMSSAWRISCCAALNANADRRHVLYLSCGVFSQDAHETNASPLNMMQLGRLHAMLELHFHAVHGRQSPTSTTRCI